MFVQEFASSQANKTPGFLETATPVQLMILGGCGIAAALIVYVVTTIVMSKYGPNDEDDEDDGSFFEDVLRFFSLALLLGGIYALYLGLFGW